MSDKKHNYIRDDIIIDFPLPRSLQQMIAEAEEYDEQKK